MSSIVGATLASARALGLAAAELPVLLRWTQDHQRYLNKLGAAVKAGEALGDEG
jgi:hypothetical protein